MITVEAVTKKSGPHTAVDDVTFTAEPGLEVITLAQRTMGSVLWLVLPMAAATVTVLRSEVQ